MNGASSICSFMYSLDASETSSAAALTSYTSSKPQLKEGVEHNVRIGQVIILCIERRGRERHCIFEIIDHGQRVIYRDLCVMRTVQDASAAVNAEFIYNMRLSVMYPDRLGRGSA